MCQTLGYHRLSRSSPSSDHLFHRKVILFWSIYTMDRGNALRLGYAPAIQDYDIDTPRPVVSEQYPLAIVTMKKYWIDCAKVQGQICTRLYGPAASALLPDERARLAESLADELDQIYQQKIEVFAVSATLGVENVLLTKFCMHRQTQRFYLHLHRKTMKIELSCGLLETTSCTSALSKLVDHVFWSSCPY